LTIRSMAASTRLRTPASNVRTLSLMIASSGITFSFVPAWSEPTVTTADSAAATSRETTVCNRITVAAAITTGSMLACGIEPCAPRPNRRICRLSAAEVIAPVRPATTPAGHHDVLAQHDSRPGKPVEQTIVNHGLSTFRGLFARLEDCHHRPMPLLSCLRQQRGRADKPGHVHVMATHVPDRHRVPPRIFRLDLACIGQTRGLLDRQRIHVGAQHDGRPIAIAEQANDTGFADACCYFIAGGTKTIRRQACRTRLLHREFWM
jgi:hypothetical protein